MQEKNPKEIAETAKKIQFDIIELEGIVLDSVMGGFDDGGFEGANAGNCTDLCNP
jgi:hypothetical protein